MRTPKKSRSKSASGRHRFGRGQDDHIIDPYMKAAKLAEPAVCPQCQALYRGGRWQWGKRPKDAKEIICQACRRTNERFPAGIVTLTGPVTPLQRVELVRLARHQEEAERPEHPLNRIIEVAEEPEKIVITTTDIHLPRRIGQAVERAFHGTLDVKFDASNYFVRVDWRAKE